MKPPLAVFVGVCLGSTALAAGPDWRIVVNFGPYGSVQEAADSYRKVNWLDDDVGDDTVCTEAFAATELRHYLCKLTGTDPDDAGAFAIIDDDAAASGPLLLVGNAQSNREIARRAASLGWGEPQDAGAGGFRIRSVPDGDGGLVVLAGDDRVGTLYAVYAFLEALGVRWFGPGAVNEEVPRIERLAIPTLNMREKPAFLTRGLWAWEDRAGEDFFLWMARNRMNLWTVACKNPASLKRLGMTLTCGGHQHMPRFMNPTHEFPYRQAGFSGNEDKPPDPYPQGEGKGDVDGDGRITYAEAHPEWFGWQDGKRSFKIKNEFGDNFCTSDPHAVAEFLKNLVTELATGEWKWANRVQFFMLDGGRWCTCDACKALGEPNDRNVLLVRQLRRAIVRAREAGQLNRDLSIVFSCYTGYLDPPARPLPADFDYEHCIAGFYPIRRCFAHTFASPDCTEFNRIVHDKYDGWFLGPAHQYRGQFFVGEYYNISGNKSLPSGFSHSMAVDIPYYYKTGARHMDYMHVPHNDWGTRSLTNCQFAKMLWNPSMDVDAFRDDYFNRRYGGAAGLMRVFYDRLEFALSNAKMLKYKLARGLSAGSTDVFPMQHQKYEPIRFEHNNAPSLLESVAEMRACRVLIDCALSKDLPDRIRARITEDADLFAYGESTVHFLDHLVLVDRFLRAGQEDLARQELAEASVYAEKLEADTRSTSSASAHANAANGLAASSAEAAYRRFQGRLSQAGGATTKKARKAKPTATTASTEAAADEEDVEPGRKEQLDFEWSPFPDDAKSKLLGLQWFDENKPKLWRMPQGQFDTLPKGVQGRSRSPAGGRIAMRCNTTRLALRVTPQTKGSVHGFDVYIDGRFFRSAIAEKPNVEVDLVLFQSLDGREKDILIYLPCHQEVTIRSIGVDRNAKFASPEHRFARPLPAVFYGSSVCQGSGSSKPGMTYEAILCRELNLDFVNLGFGGAGKAEKTVVDLVNSIPACCYVFDLGKSYGMQDKTAYKSMLETVRKAHPDVPIICITPITSALEAHSRSYSEKSVHTRMVMREAVSEFLKSGEKNVYLLEGADLLGFDEHDGLSKDGVHPSDHGFSIIAHRLSPTVRRILGL